MSNQIFACCRFSYAAARWKSLSRYRTVQKRASSVRYVREHTEFEGLLPRLMPRSNPKFCMFSITEQNTIRVQNEIKNNQVTGLCMETTLKFCTEHAGIEKKTPVWALSSSSAKSCIVGLLVVISVLHSSLSSFVLSGTSISLPASDTCAKQQKVFWCEKTIVSQLSVLEINCTTFSCSFASFHFCQTTYRRFHSFQCIFFTLLGVNKLQGKDFLLFLATFFFFGWIFGMTSRTS